MMPKYLFHTLFPNVIVGGIVTSSCHFALLLDTRKTISNPEINLETFVCSIVCFANVFKDSLISI